MSLNSCRQDEPVADPELRLTDSTVVAGAAGGVYHVEYSVTDPVDGGYITASAGDEVDWIDGFDASGDSRIEFTVAENEVEEQRTAEVTVVYTFQSGERTASFTVLQEPASQDEPDDPVVKEPELKWDEERMVIDQPGTSMTLSFSLVNPVEGGSLEVSSPAEWLSELTLATDSTVTMTVTSNAAEDVRETEITLEYTFNDGTSDRTVDAVMTLVQLGTSGEDPGGEPEIVVNSSTVELSADAGEKIFLYTIENPAADGEMSASSQTSWLSGFDCSVDGEISYFVEENTLTEKRSGSFTMTYTYGDQSVEKVITVNQAAMVDVPEPTDDVRFDFAVESVGNNTRITVTADNGTSPFFVGLIKISDFENSGMSWYEVAAQEAASQKNKAGIFGWTLDQVASKGSWTTTMSFSDMAQYVYAFSVDENWNVVSEVQYASLQTPGLSVGSFQNEFAAMGGQADLAFTISNNVAGSSLSVTDDADWITLGTPQWDSSVTGPGTSTDGTVSVTVSENTTGSAREGVITLTYTAEGKEHVTEVAVSQKTIEPTTLDVPNTTYTVSAEGGEITVLYTINNNDEEFYLYGYSDNSWIEVGNPSWDKETVGQGTAAQGSIVLTISENTGSQRAGRVTLCYGVGDGEESYIDVNVVQDASASDPEPAISWDNTSFTVSAEGGEIMLPFTLRDNVENTGMYVYAPNFEDWVTLGDIEWDSSITGAGSVVEGQCTITVSPNTSGVEREMTLVIVYYSNDWLFDDIYAETVVIQSAM